RPTRAGPLHTPAARSTTPSCPRAEDRAGRRDAPRAHPGRRGGRGTHGTRPETYWRSFRRLARPPGRRRYRRRPARRAAPRRRSRPVASRRPQHPAEPIMQRPPGGVEGRILVAVAKPGALETIDEGEQLRALRIG